MNTQWWTEEARVHIQVCPWSQGKIPSPSSLSLMLAVGFGRHPTSSWGSLFLWVAFFGRPPWHAGSQFLTRDWTHALLWWKHSVSHWPKREFPRSLFIPSQHLRFAPWVEGSQWQSSSHPSPRRKGSGAATVHSELRVFCTCFLTSFHFPRLCEPRFWQQ